MRFIIPAAVFVALFAFLFVGLSRDPSYVPSPLVGKPAPAFSLPTLSNPDESVSEDIFLGQYSLLNVWATWCVGCRQEHDALLAIARDSGIPIYGLNWKDDSDAARSWLQQLGDPYREIAVDLDGRVAIDYGVYGAPETFLINPEGKVIYKHIAPITMEIWEQEFMTRIREGSAQ